MRQRTLIVLAALLVAAVAAVPVAGLAATGDAPAQTDNETNSTNATDDSNATAPGEQLAGVVDVQEAEVEGEVDERAYGIKVAKANSNDSKADVVKAQLDDVENRLQELEQRKQNLTEARENGSISDGRYRAEMSRVAAETQTAKRLANQSENVSQGLPVDVLESKGINVTAIQTLQQQAQNISGPEVAQIARSIAGPNVGGPPGDRGPGERPDQAPDNRGPGGERGPAGNQTDGEIPDGNTTDGNQTDGEMPDGNTTDGNQTDGEMPDGNTTDGNTTDGNQTDGETPGGEDDARSDETQTDDQQGSQTPAEGPRN